MPVKIQRFKDSPSDPSSTLNASILAGDTSLVVVSAAEFPSAGYFHILVDDELIGVGAVSGTTFSQLDRGLDGTTASAHSAGAPVNSIVARLGVERWMPEYVDQPRHHNMVGWTISPRYLLPQASPPVAGRVELQRIFIPEKVTLANLLYYVKTAGTGAQLPVNVFGCVYSKGGVLLGKTADQATPVQSVGTKIAALTVEAGQSLVIDGGPDVFVYAGILIGTQSSTAVSLARGNADTASVNMNLTAGTDYLQAAISQATALTAPPANINFLITSAGGIGNSNISYFFGLS